MSLLDGSRYRNGAHDYFMLDDSSLEVSRAFDGKRRF